MERVDLHRFTHDLVVNLVKEPPSDIMSLMSEALIQYRKNAEALFQKNNNFFHAYFRHNYTDYEQVIDSIHKISVSGGFTLQQFEAARKGLHRKAKRICANWYDNDVSELDCRLNRIRRDYQRMGKPVIDLRDGSIYLTTGMALNMSDMTDKGTKNSRGNFAKRLSRLYGNRYSLFDMEKQARWYRYYDCITKKPIPLPSLDDLDNLENRTLVYSTVGVVVSYVQEFAKQALLDAGEGVEAEDGSVHLVYVIPDEWMQ